jgi:hypothetical protein
MRTFKTAIIVITAVSALGLGSARADQPHMKAALEHLRAARAELQRASHDKGGWRMRAMKNIDQAIADTQQGMSYDRQH